MPSDWVKHDGSDCPAELAGHHRVDIETAVGFMNSVRADKVNWKNVTAWRWCSDELNRTTPEGAGVLSTYGYHLAGVQSLKDNQEAEQVKSPSVQSTLEQRGSRYGDFTDNAMISQQLKQLIMCESDGKLREGYRRCNFVQREALEMIAQKIARILNGDPNYRDNWHDIQGYARLAEERCKE
jgi:hypothetical protein